ncbi:MAG: hypothetical protein J6X10_04250 [Bacteroidales bacterium]|nr:hypothetical protein [Bacteroidales bacterium]
MKKIFKIWMMIFVALTASLTACNSKPENPNAPEININFTIYPNTLEYQELNAVGGWMYVTAPLPSYGIIIYRYNIDEFRAYERQAPNSPHACPDNRLYVELPYVIDSCMDYKYSILDGSLIEGSGYPLIQYFTQFDGSALRVYN